MGVECVGNERHSSFNKNFINKNNFDKKYLIGKGGLSKVI